MLQLVPEMIPVMAFGPWYLSPLPLPLHATPTPMVGSLRALFKMMHCKNFDKCTKMSHEFVVQTKRGSCSCTCCYYCSCCWFCLVSLFTVGFFMYLPSSSSTLQLLFLLSITQTKRDGDGDEVGDGNICSAAYTCFAWNSKGKNRVQEREVPQWGANIYHLWFTLALAKLYTFKVEF